MAEQHFTCVACGAEFGSRRELEEHNRRAHPDAGNKTPGKSPKERKISDM
ncbi:MAG TPA: hypothetical protein VG454_05995 [Gemmatimonadales bacterium]|nr:hypothetical protein [Gemmatimonadales bacterium]